MASASGRRNTKPPGHLDDYIVQSVGVNSVESVGPRVAAAAAAAEFVNNHTTDENNILVNNSITTNEQGIVRVELSEKPSSARFLRSFSDFWFVGP